MNFLKKFFSNLITLIIISLFFLAIGGIIPLCALSISGWAISWKIGFCSIIGLFIDLAFIFTILDD